MSQEEEYGPVGAPQEDLEEQSTYDGATPADATEGPATPLVEPLPGEQADDHA